ncbi:Uncharacterised protein [Mycobacteroides abscessus subsp. massiliense]|nr:Uncharacterised protein [Mycobacteroides abscessus subsp. massiliense]
MRTGQGTHPGIFGKLHVITDHHGDVDASIRHHGHRVAPRREVRTINLAEQMCLVVAATHDAPLIDEDGVVVQLPRRNTFGHPHNDCDLVLFSDRTDRIEMVWAHQFR